MSAAHQLFIGYRRDDGGHAGRLYDRLAEAFSADAVFIDREDLTPGQPFRQELAEAIRQARVCLVVIGQHWFAEKNRQRLFEEDDITHGEIRTALECVEAGNGYSVIPILAGGATMPAEEHLPPDIAKLPCDHAHTLEDTRYKPSVDALIDLLVNQYGLQKALVTKMERDVFNKLKAYVAEGHLTKEQGEKVREQVALQLLLGANRTSGN